jgi:transposase
VSSLRQLTEITMLIEVIADLLADHRCYQVIQQLPGIGPVLAAVITAEIGDVIRFKNPGQLAAFGRARRAAASRSAATARYPWLTRLRASSRLTAGADRQTRRAISRTASPAAARPRSPPARPGSGTGPRAAPGGRDRTPPRCWIHAHAAISLTPAASAA